MVRKSRRPTLRNYARQDVPSSRRRSSQLLVCAALVACICIQRGYAALVPHGRTGPPKVLRRREASTLLVPAGMVPAWFGLDAAAEESDSDSVRPGSGGFFDIGAIRDDIVKGARRKAKEEAKTGGLAGANRFRKGQFAYNVTELQSYLPKLYLAQRHYDSQLRALENPKVDIGNPDVYSTLKNDIRKGPGEDLRTATKMVGVWLKKAEDDNRAADVELERIKNVINKADSQMRRLGLRTEGSTGRVEAAAARATKRSLQDVIDAIDDVLGFLPEEEQKVASALAETQVSKIPRLRLPLKSKSAKKNATAARNSTATNSTGVPASSPAPAPPTDSVLGSVEKVRFGSLLEEAPMTQ